MADSPKPDTTEHCLEQSSNEDAPQATVYDSPITHSEGSTTQGDRLPTTLSTSGESEISVLDCLRVTCKYKWMIIIITAVAMAATVAWSMSQPRVYQASTSIVPPIDRLQRDGGLASKLGGAGSLLMQGMLNQGDLSGLYVGILKSRAVAEAMIDRFDLMNVYRKKTDLTRTMARKILKNNTSINASKEGIVHIAVKDLDPTRSSEIANAYVEELDMQNKRLSGGQATSKRVFLETRLNEIQGELSKIESLQSREVQIKEMLFELLNRECEIAKIEEAKSMPTIQILDQAIVPEYPVGRQAIQKGLWAGVAAVMLGFFIAFGRECVDTLRLKT